MLLVRKAYIYICGYGEDEVWVVSILVNPGFDFRFSLEKFEARFLSRVYEITS